MRSIPLLFLLLLLSPAAEKLRYLPGDDARPLIRRDLLPLDVDSIRELAEQLAILADGPFPKSADSVQHRVKSLTLSQRLDPTQSRARAIEQALLEGNDRPPPKDEEKQSALSGVLDHAGWLAELPSDSEGHLLGRMLLDIIRPLAPNHRLLKKDNASHYPDPWNQVIAKTVDFKLPDSPRPPRPRESSDLNRKKYAVTALLTEVPMISMRIEEDPSPPSPGLVATSLVITRAPFSEEKEGSPPSQSPGKLIFKPEPDPNLNSLHDVLIDFFATHLQALPVGFNLNINTNKQRYLSENRDNLTAPIAMMLDSAVTGRDLRRNTILFARLHPDGTLKKPAKSWDLLHALASQPRNAETRLIVAPGMLGELTGLLVLDQPSFFIDFEVIEAATFAEARPLFFEDGTLPASLQDASDGYLVVRDKADLANNLRNFLSLSSVETRLTRASRLSPRHLSAKLLATQSIRRPIYFTRSLAARDLNRRLDPVSRFRFIIDQTTEDDLKEAYQKSRALIDPLERLLKLSDRELLSEAVSVVKKINSIGRDASSDPVNRQKIWQDDFQDFHDRLQQFREKLREIATPNASGN